MSLSLTSTLAAVGITASLAVGGVTAVVLSAGDDHPGPARRSIQRVESTAGHVGDALDDAGVRASSSSLSAKVKSRGASGKVKGAVSASSEEQRARASASVPGHGNVVVSGTASGGSAPVVPPSSGSPGPGGPYSPEFPDLAAPSAPSLSQIPTSASAEGSYSVVVPPTEGTSKLLCLNGEVNRCKTITVSPTPGRTVVLRWTGNAGTTPPTFDVNHCRGGLSVTVKGLATGAGLTVAVDGHELSRTVSSRERSQTASLCDA